MEQMCHVGGWPGKFIFPIPETAIVDQKVLADYRPSVSALIGYCQDRQERGVAGAVRPEQVRGLASGRLAALTSFCRGGTRDIRRGVDILRSLVLDRRQLS